MISRTLIELTRDSYEPGLTIDEYVDFFHDCQKVSAAEHDKLYDEGFADLADEELRELAQEIIKINEED